MADHVLTCDGVLETANGRTRVYKGRTVSLTDWEFAHNAHLFVPEHAPEVIEYRGKNLESKQMTRPVVVDPADLANPSPLAEVMKPVRHTPKAEPARKGPKR